MPELRRFKPVSHMNAACLRLIFTAVLLVSWRASEPDAAAQGSRADYERSGSLSRTFQGKVFRDRVEAHWLSNGAQFWYESRTGTNSREFVFVDTEKGERRPAFDHAKLARALNKAGLKDMTAENLRLREIEWKA